MERDRRAAQYLMAVAAAPDGLSREGATRIAGIDWPALLADERQQKMLTAIMLNGRIRRQTPLPLGPLVQRYARQRRRLEQPHRRDWSHSIADSLRMGA